MPKLCIIGGGASALAAAVTAAKENPGLSICILEKKECLGKKLAATGNGKCNLSNRACREADQILSFFSSLGILTRTDEQGRIYPYSQQARDVVYSLEHQVKARKIQVKTNCPVTGLERTGQGFTVAYEGGKLKAQRVLLAAGGKAGPQFGTSGDGYTMAKSMGHTVTRLAPVLTGIETEQDLSDLKGVRVRGAVSLYEDGRRVFSEKGEIQFNEDSISGICVLNLSRFLRLREGENFSQGMRRFQVAGDFMPDMGQDQVKELLQERSRGLGMKPDDLLLSLVPAPLAARLLKEAGLKSKEAGSDAGLLSEVQINKLGKLLKGWNMQVKGTKGWKSAQCTAGGVSLEEIDMETMESKLVPGLYFSGEMIDYDGPCGGFNLQNAWETGMKAGKAAAHYVSDPSD